jgi:hypothetical protein
MAGFLSFFILKRLILHHQKAIRDEKDSEMDDYWNILDNNSCWRVLFMDSLWQQDEQSQ